MAVKLAPYLFFKGQSREAMEFYKQVFGGELTMQAYSEVPGDMPGKEEHPDWLMHARLEGDFTLMASDTNEASPKMAKVSLSLTGEDEDKLRKVFESLSEGGKVLSALKKEFWGDTFGSLIDKYGVEWMVNISDQS